MKLAIHRRHGQKNNPPFINLIYGANDSLLSLRIVPNCDDTIMEYIVVNSESSNLTDVPGKSISSTGVASETG